MSEEIIPEKGSRQKRLIRNAFFSALSWILPLGLGFIATPIILEGLGEEDYGLYVLILGFVGYSFTFGIGRAVIKYVSEYRAQKRTDEVKKVVSTTFWLTVIIGSLGVSAIILLAEIIVEDVLLISPENQDLAVKALYIAAPTVLALVISQVFQAVVQSVHSFDRLSLLLNTNAVLLAAGSITLVWWNLGVLALLWWNFFITMLIAGLFFYNSRKLLPEMTLSFRIDRKIIKLLLKYGSAVIAYQIFGNILLLFERGLITRYLGAEALTHYVIPMMLAVYLHGFIGTTIMVIFPVISEIQNEKEMLIRLYQKVLKIVLAVTVFAVITLICSSKLFLSVWINREFAVETFQILNLQAITFGMLAVFTVVWQLAEGFDSPRFNAFISFFWLIVAIPLMIIFIFHWQTNGVALSRLISVALSFPLIFYAEKKFLGKFEWRFWIKNILKLAVAASLTAIFEYYVYLNLETNWVTFFTGSIFGVFVFALALFILGFVSKEEKQLIKKLVVG